MSEHSPLLHHLATVLCSVFFSVAAVCTTVELDASSVCDILTHLVSTVVRCADVISPTFVFHCSYFTLAFHVL